MFSSSKRCDNVLWANQHVDLQCGGILHEDVKHALHYPERPLQRHDGSRQGVYGLYEALLRTGHIRPGQILQMAESLLHL